MPSNFEYLGIAEVSVWRTQDDGSSSECHGVGLASVRFTTDGDVGSLYVRGIASNCAWDRSGSAAGAFYPCVEQDGGAHCDRDECHGYYCDGQAYISRNLTIEASAWDLEEWDGTWSTPGGWELSEWTLSIQPIPTP